MCGVAFHAHEHSHRHAGVDTRRGWGRSIRPGRALPSICRPTLARSGPSRSTSSFYAVPDARVVRAWAERSPAEFIFALKMPKEITHERRLCDADDLVRDFLDRARLLRSKLGPILLQMGPDFAPDELPALEQFVPTLPDDLRFAVELRQKDWMGPEVVPHLLELLARHGIALALSDGKWIARETMLELAERPDGGLSLCAVAGAGP